MTIRFIVPEVKPLDRVCPTQWPASQISPHATQPRRDIDADCRLWRRGIIRKHRHRRGRPGKERQYVVRQKPRARGEHVTTSVTMLLGPEKFNRLDQIQMFLRASHCDVKQATLFFDLR